MLREITARAIRDYQAARAGEVSPRTVNLAIKLLRGILKVEGQWKRLAEDVKPLKASGESPGRALIPEAAVSLFDVAESRAEWIIAHLTMVIANHTGLRDVELRNLRVGDVDVGVRSVKLPA